MFNPQELAEAVRTACIKTALETYEEGGVLGLCAEGRWEYAISALQQLDLDPFATAHIPDSSAYSEHGKNRG